MDPFVVLDQLEQVVARAYTRVSSDRSGRAKSTGQQDDDLAGDCVRCGWVKGDSYSDNSKSASRYIRDLRGDFEALIDDLERDRFGARVLLLWESSRGRRVGEWVQLIDLCELRRVYIWVHTHSRLYDPANARDRRTLLEDAVDSEYESGKTSSRVTRDIAAAALEGRPHGRCPYGYQRVYDPRTGKLVGQEPHPDEKPHIEELFARWLAGHSTYEIAVDWDGRGIRTRSGRKWRKEHLRTLLMRPCYAGLRAHVPGRTNGGGSRMISESHLTVATWPGLVSVDDWRWVQHRMRESQERSAKGEVPRPGKGKYLLSHIAGCAVCEGPLTVGYRPRGAEYGCNERGCVRILMADLDQYVESMLLEYLAQPEVIDDIRRRECADSDEVAALREERSRLRALNIELAEALSSEKISITLAGAAERQNLAKIEALDKQIQKLTVASPLRGLIEAGADVSHRWAQAPMSARRVIVRALCSPERLGQVRVSRVSARRGSRRVPARERVVFWRPDEAAASAAS